MLALFDAVQCFRSDSGAAGQVPETPLFTPGARDREPRLRQAGGDELCGREKDVQPLDGLETACRPEEPRVLGHGSDPGGKINDMAVHDYGTIAIVSFKQGAIGGTVFVVDVWRGQGTDWKLAVRYASSAGTPTFAIPGGDASEPEIPKKY